MLVSLAGLPSALCCSVSASAAQQTSESTRHRLRGEVSGLGFPQHAAYPMQGWWGCGVFSGFPPEAHLPVSSSSKLGGLVTLG